MGSAASRRTLVALCHDRGGGWLAKRYPTWLAARSFSCTFRRRKADTWTQASQARGAGPLRGAAATLRGSQMSQSVIPYSLKDAPALIERLLPVQKLCAEAYKEQEGRQSKTLTPLGSYWKGRKPLILRDRKSTRLNSSHLGIS